LLKSLNFVSCVHEICEFHDLSNAKKFKALRRRSALTDVCIGIFVAFTLTAVMALVVFWRKSNTVFALQKCEQRDIDDEVF